MSQTTTEAAIWTDAEGRTWSTAINVNAIRRAKDLVGVNLLDVFDGELLPRLADDPVLLVNTLYAVCKPQADERNVGDEAFGELLVGDAIETAERSSNGCGRRRSGRGTRRSAWRPTSSTRHSSNKRSRERSGRPATRSTNGCAALAIRLGTRRNPRRRSRPPDAPRTALDARRAASRPVVPHRQSHGAGGQLPSRSQADASPVRSGRLSAGRPASAGAAGVGDSLDAADPAEAQTTVREEGINDGSTVRHDDADEGLLLRQEGSPVSHVKGEPQSAVESRRFHPPPGTLEPAASQEVVTAGPAAERPFD
jgi:hypothetical protein